MYILSILLVYYIFIQILLKAHQFFMSFPVASSGLFCLASLNFKWEPKQLDPNVFFSLHGDRKSLVFQMTHMAPTSKEKHLFQNLYRTCLLVSFGDGTLLGTNNIPSQVTSEDDFPFPQVGYEC